MKAIVMAMLLAFVSSSAHAQHSIFNHDSTLTQDFQSGTAEPAEPAAESIARPSMFNAAHLAPLGLILVCGIIFLTVEMRRHSKRRSKRRCGR